MNISFKNVAKHIHSILIVNGWRTICGICTVNGWMAICTVKSLREGCKVCVLFVDHQNMGIIVSTCNDTRENNGA